VLEKLATCYVTLFHEKNTDSVLWVIHLGSSPTLVKRIPYVRLQTQGLVSYQA
jgi:hypothetical protein